VDGETVELVVPELAIHVEPGRRLTQRCGVEPDVSDPSDATPLDEPSALEHAQVLADRRERHGERPGQLAHGVLALGQACHDRAARGVGEGVEDAVEGTGLVNHLV